MMRTRRQAGCARHRALPRTPRGLRPCDPENPPMKDGKFEAFVPLPLVGPEEYTLLGCLPRLRVTFSIDPTETAPGYIIK